MRSAAAVLFAWTALLGCEPSAEGGGGAAEDAGGDCGVACEGSQDGGGALSDAAPSRDASPVGRDAARPDAGAPPPADADAAPPPADASAIEPPEDASPPDAAPRSPPAGPCRTDEDCAGGGRCERAPGGFCSVPCRGDLDCGDEALCLHGFLGLSKCHAPCAEDADCRDGWFCTTLLEDEPPSCQPTCDQLGCPDGERCDRRTHRCEPLPCEPAAEVCNGLDDDCDGEVDEGVRNACGGCGPPPAEACNGLDDDCDGIVDGPGSCPAGQRCEAGVCRALAGFAEACRESEDCAAGVCLRELPDGFCAQICRVDGDCPGGRCVPDGGASACLLACGAERACRAGWVCEAAVCRPDCRLLDRCAGGTRCRGATGLCEVPLYTVVLEQVILRPYIAADRSNWDGLGSASQELVQALTGALVGADPLAAVLGILGGGLVDATAAPDPYGTAELLVAGVSQARNLPERGNEYRPRWNVSWAGVRLDAGDVRLRVSLTDADVAVDDQIGSATATLADLQAAAASGGAHAVDTSANPPGNGILFLVIQVIPQN